MKSIDISWVEELTGSKHIRHELVQQLWSGYGQLVRLFLDDGTSVILKEIEYSTNKEHPRGWATNISDERKRKSYQIEGEWYENLAKKLHENTKIPNLIAVKKDTSVSLLLEDLNALGYDQRPKALDTYGVKKVLKWLARFHATYMGVQPTGLWPIGTYWHLDTRPDELHAMDDSWLKSNAHKIDEVLNNARFQTVVHGDAKLANFCFTNMNDVAAVDFQYVGGGCGMKDVAYFLSSCLSPEDALNHEKELLDRYFHELSLHTPPSDFKSLEKEWRRLYPVAWADFVRFLKGWAPDHKKLNAYSYLQLEKTKKVIG